MRQSPLLAALTRSLFAKVLTRDESALSDVAATKEDSKEEHIMDIFKETWERTRPPSPPIDYIFQHITKTKPALFHTTTKPAVSPTSSVPPSSPLEKKDIFPLMDLPPELRLTIYREHLVSSSGYITLLGTPLGILNKNKVHAGISTTLLRVSKTIYHEAKDLLLKENAIIVMADVHVSNHPVIPKYLLPDHILSEVVSMTLVCEMCTNAASHHAPSLTKFESQMVWRRMQDLTSLKSVRLIIIERADQKDENEQREEMLACILQRIPSSCTLTYGSDKDEEKAFVELVIMETDEPGKKLYYSYADSYEVDAAIVRKAAEVAMEKVEKGCKSGDTMDYRFPKREIVLKPLGGGDGGGEGIDPRFVLGGGQ